MIGFLIGVITGAAITWYARHRRVAAYRRDRDYWWDIAEHRATELKAADDQEKLYDEEITRLARDLIRVTGEKTELNRLLDMHGILR